MNSKFWVYVSLIASSIAFILSIFSICVSCYRTEELGFDYIGVIIGILAILVAILLSWQIYKYSDWKNTLSDIVNSQLEIVTHDYTDYVNSLTQLYSRGVVINNRRAPFLFDTAIEELNNSNSLNNEVLKKHSINFLYKYLNDLCIMMRNTGFTSLYSGKKNHYEYIIKEIKHEFQESVLDLLNQATYDTEVKFEDMGIDGEDGGVYY